MEDVFLQINPVAHVQEEQQRPHLAFAPVELLLKPHNLNLKQALIQQ